MSEQQVLPELPDLDCTPEEIAAGQEYADACGDHELRPFVAIKNANYRCRNRQLLAALASLAQSEAERERLQEANDVLTRVVAATIERAATAEAELAESHELFKATFGLATENANKLAREREANQGLREVVSGMRSVIDGAGDMGFFDTDRAAALVIKADALLEPKPVATTS